RFFTVLGIIFYTTVSFLVGGAMIAFSFRWIAPGDLSNIVDFIIQPMNSRIIFGLAGLLLILLSISFAQLILGKIQRERTIAFSNPLGQVTISLIAVEDLIKRLVSSIYEIRELRPDVIAGKKGLEVDLRIILRAETNIPDLTMRLQDLIKNKVQETLGVEEPIVVRIHVAKIVAQEEKKKKEEHDFQNPTIPFHDYGKP
ncbi:MAG: alkaline shock response membrane anchor protein AmaP, partial [Candidatus Omnitrophota bacterium]